MPPLSNRMTASAVKPETNQTTVLVTRIIALIDELVAVMEEEVPMVEGRKRAEHAELLKRKQRLTLDYRASIKAIILDPTLLNQVPDNLRVEARKAADRLAEASNRNSRIIRAVMTASQRLVQTIVAMIKEEVLPKSGYSNKQTGQSGGGYSPICKPVTIFKTA